MRNGKEVQKLLIDRFDRLESKVDKLFDIVPTLDKKIEVMKAETLTEAKTVSKIHGRIWGVITAAIALASVGVAILALLK